MIRQLLRLLFFILVKVKDIVVKHPGASIGITSGAVIGCILGTSMVRHGFPGWVLPVQIVLWAVFLVPRVKSYLDKFTK